VNGSASPGSPMRRLRLRLSDRTGPVGRKTNPSSDTCRHSRGQVTIDGRQAPGCSACELDSVFVTKIASQRFAHVSSANQSGICSVQRVESSRWSKLMRCLLVIAAWQAPLPFWHKHGTLATATAESAAWLTDHLHAHHPAIDPFSQLVFGWHLHFALPDSGDEAPDAPKPTREQVVVVPGLASWDVFIRLKAPFQSRMFADALVVSQRPLADRGMSAFQAANGFFTDFASEMTLPVRLGVLHC